MAVQYTSKLKLSQEEGGNIKYIGLSHPLADKEYSTVYLALLTASFLSINPSLVGSNHDEDFHIAALPALM